MYFGNRDVYGGVQGSSSDETATPWTRFKSSLSQVIQMSPKRKRLLGIGLLVAVVVALSLPKLLRSDQGIGVATAARQDTLRVEAYVAAPGPLEDRIYTTGSIRANESVDLVSEASGKITGIFFNEGSAVRAGQLLVKINDADLEAQRERAEVRLSLAQKREARQRQLLERGSVSQDEYDLALNEVNVLDAEVRVIAAQIERTEIRAPFSGIVGLRYVSEGSYISPQTRIASLQSLNPVKVDFSVPERYAGRVSAGHEIVFQVTGIDQMFRGRIYAVEPSVRQDTRSLQIRAQSPNPNGLLLPGAFADVELLIDRIESALTVPSMSIIPEMEGRKVFLYRDGLVTEQSVVTGIRTEQSVQVLDGMVAGDTVIVSGIQMVRPGMPVKIDRINS